MRLLVSAFRLFKDSFRAFLSDRSTIYAAGLAYYAVFAIGPLLVFLSAVAGYFVGRSNALNQISAQVESLVGPRLAGLLTDLATTISQRTFGSGGTTILSIAVLVVGAAGIFHQLDKAINDIWGITSVRPQGTRDRLIQLRRRAAPFGVLFVLGLLFTSAMMLDTVLGALSTRLTRFLPEFINPFLHINRLVIPALAFALFTVIFKWLPEARSRWRDVAVGGLVTTLLFLVGRLLLTFYLNRAGTISLFGSVGAIVILLVWVYYSAQILLFGAEFTKLYADRFGQPIVPRRLAAFRDDGQPAATRQPHATPTNRL